jgi:hypothetical protein
LGMSEVISGAICCGTRLYSQEVIARGSGTPRSHGI